jgi:hypothetical protein
MKTLKTTIILLLTVCSLFTFTPASARLRKDISLQNENEKIIEKANNVANGLRNYILSGQRTEIEKKGYFYNIAAGEMDISHYKDHKVEPGFGERLPINNHLLFLFLACIAIGTKHLMAKNKRTNPQSIV